MSNETEIPDEAVETPQVEPDTTELEAELATARKRIAELEAKLSESQDEKPEEEKIRAIKNYKMGTFVSVKIPGHVDPQDGRVLEHLTGKSTVLVATEKGEFPIGDPNRIRLQGTEW